MHTRAPMRPLKSSLFLALMLVQLHTLAQDVDLSRDIALADRHPNRLPGEPGPARGASGPNRATNRHHHQISRWHARA